MGAGIYLFDVLVACRKANTEFLAAMQTEGLPAEAAQHLKAARQAIAEISRHLDQNYAQTEHAIGDRIRGCLEPKEPPCQD